MKVVLFDLETGGHHLQYASYLVRYLKDKGDQVVFVTWKLTERLNRIRSLGATVEFVSHSSFTSEYGAETPKRLWQLYRGFQKCVAISHEIHADVIHHLYLDRSWLPLWLNINLGYEVNSRVFGTLFWPHFLDMGIQSSVRKVGKRLYNNMNRYCFHALMSGGKLDNLFVHTDYTKSILLSTLSSIDESNLTVIPDPIEPFFDKLSQSAARKALQLPLDRVILLFFGRFRFNKGADILLDAFTLLNQECTLVLAGEPDYPNQKAVKEYSLRLENSSRLITRLGFIPDEDVKKYFLAADVVILPYRKHFQSTSGILQHAAAAGRPMVATDIGRIGPTIRNEGLGAVVEPGSPRKLAEGIDNFLSKLKGNQDDIKRNLISYAEAHHWKKMANIVRRTYIRKLGT